MDEQMNNNGYQYQPNPSPMPNPNKDGIAIAVFVLGIVSICLCCIAWGVISLACAIVSLVLYSRNKTMFSPHSFPRRKCRMRRKHRFYNGIQ